jgi:adenine-specific DNA-methyltransferase
MTQRLELVWPGKEKFLLVPRDESGKPVWVEPDHPAAREVRLTDFTSEHGEVNESDPYGDNLLFTGDSLDVLRVLREVPEYARHYRGKVKLCYIDPPFNTGQTFTHYDDWMEHSTWLSFMRDRLLLIKDLLAPDGSVWVHLDDAEVHRMRCLMDEVFGGENFVSTIVWQKVHARDNRTTISTSQDYITVYARNLNMWSSGRNLLPRTAEQLSGYQNPDNDPRGPWTSSDLSAKAGPGRRASQFYTIVSPAGKAFEPAKGRCWLLTEDRYEEFVADGRIYFGSTGDSMPRLKKFLSEVQDGIVPSTWWTFEEVGNNQDAKREMKAVFGDGEPFTTPKPERLLERVIHIGSNPGDIVLDCFGGSGTTAAVAHKMGRRWVTAEVLPATVATFTAERLKKVADGNDPGGITDAVEWKGGGGFRQVMVSPSMYELTPLGVMLADWATNGRFARAVAGQLGFEWQANTHPLLCGVRGRMRLAVFDGAVGLEEAREVIAALGERERVTIVAKVVLPGVEEFIAEQSKGSRVKKAPRDLLLSRTRPVRRRAEGTL